MGAEGSDRTESGRSRDDEPVATVVIQTHDRPRTVLRALDSVLSQTVRELEVILVDDGSTPALEVPVEDARVRLVRLERAGGPAAARNAGIEIARGRWIVFLDDDDELAPDMLETSLRAAFGSHLPTPVAVLSGITVVDEDGTRIEHRRPVTLARGARYFLERTSSGGFRCDRTLMAPTDVVRSIGGFDGRFRASEDKDFFLRLNAVCSLQAIDDATYRKTEHRGPSLRSEPLLRAKGIELTLAKHGDVIAHYPRQEAHLLGSMGMAYLIAGRWGPAVAATGRAVARNPRRLRHYLQLGAALVGPRAFDLARRFRARMRPIGPRRRSG